MPLNDDDLLRYLDPGLPEAERAALARALADDPAGRAAIADWQRQDAALRALYEPVLNEPLPARHAAVLDRARALPAPRPAWQRGLWASGLAAALMLAVGGGWIARGLTDARTAALSPAETGPLTVARAAMRAFDTYTVEVRHPVEVTVAEEAHLNTWMSKRLGHAIRPPDFASAGFSLLGGRILPADKGPAAMYMYENSAGQRVTLYVAAEGMEAETAFEFSSNGPTQSFTWIDRDLSYAVVGQIPRDSLRAIAVAAYDQLI
jgi:anti-sigma factor RsiW